MIMKYLWGGVGLFLMFTHWWVWNHRGEVEQMKFDKSVKEYREKELNLIADLEKAKKRREVVIRDRIQIITETVGICLDTDIPQPLLDSLRNDKPDSEASPKPDA